VHASAQIMLRSCVAASLGVLGILAAASLSCAPHLPGPPSVPQPSAAFEDVPYPPPPARIEYIPDAPRSDAKWVDGEWRWQASGWHWQRGGWYDVPPATSFARWATKRAPDGRLLFAPSTWRDGRGQEAPLPGLLASAGAGPGAVEEEEPDASAHE